ncbi:MAG TPA: SDR family NAD(P)-dependent oxidoreductase [Solirubrobacterales bacterium]|nr:SDR family NAD(P)-dependent oxidoreductase [Solirubrobacterales bacterium]
MQRQVAFITGAGSGIGAATAERLAKRGWRLALVDLDETNAQVTAQRCGSDAIAFGADITNSEALTTAVDATVERFGGIDLCFANAGVATEGTIRHTEPDVFAVQVDVNLVGTYRTVHACLPHLIASKGYMLLNASASAIGAPPGLGAYGASKAGVENLGDTLRREVKHLGVDVGVVYLLFIATDMVAGAEEHGEIFKTMRASFSGPLSKLIPTSDAVDAIEKGIDRRARRVTAPKGLIAALFRARGLAPGLLERDMLKMAPAVEEATAREKAAKGEKAGLRTDTAATAAAVAAIEERK